MGIAQRTHKSDGERGSTALIHMQTTHSTIRDRNAFFETIGQLRSLVSMTQSEALRSKLLLLIISALIASFTLAIFLGEVAITESVQIQVGVLAALLRFGAILIIALFTINSMVREFNDKTLMLLLSTRLQRWAYVMGRFLGFASIAAGTSLIFTLSLLMFAPLDVVIAWGTSLACELFIVIAFCLLCVFTMEQTPTAFASVLGFYLLSRIMSALLLIGSSPLVANATPAHQFIQYFMTGLSYLLPDLDRFTQTAWLMNGAIHANDLFFILGQTVTYLLLLVAATMFDVYRKNF